MTTTHQGAFIRLIQNIRRGMTQDELDEVLAEAQERVKETNKMATITFSVKIKPVKGMLGQFQLEDEVKSKLPDHDRGLTVMFEDKTCNLVLNDPRQTEMELKTVEAQQKTELVDLPAESPRQLKEVN